MKNGNQASIQAKVFDFALMEIVRTQRTNFQPIWTVDSWVKFLIWMALNCGFNVDRENFQLFVDALGSSVTRRMRKIFFERTLEKFSLSLMADPAESHILIMPIADQSLINFEEALEAVDFVGLKSQIIQDQSKWVHHDRIITIPWKSSEMNS